MLTVGIPVAGLAYLIRVYSGRIHWASAVLFSLFSCGGALTFLVEFTQAETPLSMSIIAAAVGGMTLALPAKWVPGIEKESESAE